MSSPNKTRVQVATDPAFSDIVHDVNGAYTTELQIAESELPVGVNLYARGMHGHPDSGDSTWSTTVQFMVAVAYGNSLYYTAGNHTFTVPAGVTEVCIAATPGADYSTAGELLKTYIGRTTACVAGNNSVPVGISSITLSGKGAAGTTTTTWNYSSQKVIGSDGYSLLDPVYRRVKVYPNPLSNPTPSSISGTVGSNSMSRDVTFNRIGLTATTATYYYQYGYHNDGTWETENYYLYYTKGATTATTGASTTAVVNGTTYTFPGGVGGAASITNHTVAVNPATGATIAATIASGGSLSYSYSAYAISALGTLLGNNFSLSPVAANVGTYSGGIAAWRNAIPVTPGSTIPVRVGSGGAVNIIWGTGRAFPNSEV